ncbi:MAG: FtsX-like permease family protein [Candidatus Dormiibacterota bacterium]
MWKVTVKGVLARKLRLALTALSIILGVAFVSGTLVLTATLNSTISTLYGNVYRHVDFQVQAPGVRNIPESLLGSLRKVPGVAYADGAVSGYSQFVAHDGSPITTGLEPASGLSFDPNTQLSPFRLVQGRGPTNSREVVMDAVTAQRYHFSVGERVRILLPGAPQTFTISGIARLIGAGAVPGATFAAFNLPTAQRLFGAIGQLYTIDILTSPGANQRQVRRDVTRLLPPGLNLVTGKTLTKQQVKTSDQSLAPLSTALLIFGFIALFVGGFTIFNTFSIIVGQRTRELALLRIVGASRPQVFQSVILEAAMVGLVASLIGLGLGVLAAMGLQAGLSALDVPLPSGSLVVGASTVLAAFAVGLGVTVASAISPAWRAVRISPVVALTAWAGEEEASSRRRVLVGGVFALVSLALLGLGLAQPAIAAVGVGAAGIFIAAAILAPLVARAMASILGRPLAKVFGVSGRLGRENSMRSPRRTAQGATALMVGLALVSAVAVLGASLAKAATSSVDNAVSADLLVTSSSGTFSPAVVTKVAHLPGVTSTCTIYGAQFEVQHSLVSVDGVCVKDLSENVILRMEAGASTSALARGELLVDATTARSHHLGVGSTVDLSFPQGPGKMIRVGGIYQPNALIPSYVVSDAFFRAHLPGQLPGGIAVSGTRSANNLKNEVTKALAPYPTLSVQTRDEFEATQAGAINQALGLVYALLALAVIIAFIGVVNTLLLAVFERTHEIGLLRAVGMKRRQVRAMIRSEAVILSLFGAIAGVLLGTALGAALTSSLKEQQNISAIVIPFSSLALFLVIAAILGLVAATWPARRAARLDVLAAIAAE